MSNTEKLQKAVATTIAAGYQLDKDAYDFLETLAETEDPTKIIDAVMEKIKEIKESTPFINKSLLKRLIEKSEPPKEIVTQRTEEENMPYLYPQITEGKNQFHPFAKEIESNIKIIEDPTEKINSTGTIKDYLEYFRDRFKRTERLLRQRVDVKNAASVLDALKSPPNSKLKIIGMVTEKREVKQKILLTVEDLSANALVLVSQNAQEELKRKARSLLLDQVICISILKTRSTLLIAEDIILPDVAQKAHRTADIPVYAVLTSDLHLGSTKFLREAFNRFILWLNGKYGNKNLKEKASHVKYVLIAGDIVDGIGVYPNQVKELAIKDIYKQYKLAAKYIEQIPDYIDVVITPGNHDAPRKALPQPAISNSYLETLQESRRIYSLGNPCTLSIHDIEILMYHGRSIDDVLSSVVGMKFGHPEAAMRLLLQSRHLAPIYGEKTPISPENRDFLVIEHVPDIFQAGHVHVLGHSNYRGVLIVNSGGWQEQTEYMKQLGLVPTPGVIPVINLQTMELTVIPFL